MHHFPRYLDFAATHLVFSVVCGLSYERHWRYHKEQKVWITRAPGVEPTARTATYEQGTYIYFDISQWKKVFMLFVRVPCQLFGAERMALKLSKRMVGIIGTSVIIGYYRFMSGFAGRASPIETDRACAML